MTDHQDPAQAVAPPGTSERVQPDCPLSGEVKRGGALPRETFVRFPNHLGFTPPYNAHARWGRLTTLYFIGHGDLTKIGIAGDVEKRLAALRAGNPEGLVLRARRSMPAPLDRQVERRMHESFAHLAIGREWFRGLDLAEGLKAATTHIRHANRAIQLWERDGFYFPA